MAHVLRTSDTEAKRLGDPNSEGTPAHFAATCRANPGQSVVCFRGVPGFVVPPDGAWFVNRMHAPAGYDRDLIEGDRVTYHAIKGDPIAAFAPRSRARSTFANVDPQTLRPLPPLGARR